MVVVSLCEGRCQLDDAGRRIKHDFGWNMQIASKFVAVEQPCNVTAAISHIRSQRPELQRVLRRRYLRRDGRYWPFERRAATRPFSQQDSNVWSR